MATPRAPHEHGRIRRPSPLSECGSAVTLTINSRLQSRARPCLSRTPANHKPTPRAPHDHGRIRRPSPLSECGAAGTQTDYVRPVRPAEPVEDPTAINYELACRFGGYIINGPIGCPGTIWRPDSDERALGTTETLIGVTPDPDAP